MTSVSLDRDDLPGVLGAVVLVALLLLAVPTAVAFRHVDRTAGLLVVPYLLWVAFAAVLNYRFLALN